MDRLPPKQLSRTREYRVQLTTLEIYEIRLTAADEESACADAEHMWFELGPDEFRYRDGRLDSVTVISGEDDDS